MIPPLGEFLFETLISLLLKHKLNGSEKYSKYLNICHHYRLVQEPSLLKTARVLMIVLEIRSNDDATTLNC